MSAQKDRQGELRGLLLEIQSGLEAIKKLTQTLQEIQESEQPTATPSTKGQMSMALSLHHLYTAMEEILLRINKVYDQIPVSSDSWHRELLRNMGLNVEDVRPSVISDKLISNLNEYRSFRHVVRHAYDYELDWSRLRPLVKNIFPAVQQFESEIKTFKAFVEENIHRLEEE